jgi:hypothetical protein
MSCGEKVCSACFKRYLVDSGDISPKCMFCSKDIAYSYTRDVLPVTWINSVYLDTRTNHLLAREKSLLPQSQDDVKDEIDRRRRLKQAEEIDNEIGKLMEQIRHLEIEKFNVLRGHRKKNNTKVVTLRRCPKEDCKGFLESDWRCGICKVKACSGCGEIKNENHECDEEIRLNFELIRRDTRPCPQCATPIHKWQGCNQMYCTQCSCMFDYRTGRLETGFFHNPHYFDALQAGTITARLQEGACNMGDRLFMEYMRVFRGHFDTKKLRNLVQLTRHINDVTLEKYQANNLDDQCRIMRRQYLMDELDETEWFKRLKMIEKKREKNKEIYQLLELFKDIGNDVIANTGEVFKVFQIDTNLHREKTRQTWKEHKIMVNNEEFTAEELILNGMSEVDRITRFINEKFTKLEKQFNSVFPRINENLSNIKT